MSRETFDFVVRSVTQWLVRPRHPEAWIFRYSAGVLTATLGAGFVLKASGRLGESSGSFEFGTGDGSPAGVVWLVTTVCLCLMAASAFWALWRFRDDWRRLSRRKVLVIEGRGLRDDDGSPLEAAVPADILGARIPYLLDLRQHKDGVIVDPDDLIARVGAMKTAFHQGQKGNDRRDLTTVYGGLTAVPLTFLTGVLLDDEGEVVVMDWDRSVGAWRRLDRDDDRIRFEVSGMENVGSAKEVVLAVSASYLVKSDDLATTFSQPVVRMTLPDVNSSHWSQTKQSALAVQFLETIKALDACGVGHIHLVLAAQNSVTFNMARRYDKRLLPSLTVYQYERSETPRYPWGIDMPVAGASPRIRRTC